MSPNFSEKNLHAPTVWVVQEVNNNYEPAEQFGLVEFITRSEITNIPKSKQNTNVHMDVREFLSKYIPGYDFIVPAGNPMTVALVTMSLPVGEHNFLKWDGRRALYVPHMISQLK